MHWMGLLQPSLPARTELADAPRLQRWRAQAQQDDDNG